MASDDSNNAREDSLMHGSLQIGDQWNAISIIAQSQTHPLKGVCELVENAIDAGATHIEITRRRKGGELFLEIVDNGSGVPHGTDGLPDFVRIATHICDSMKRHFTTTQRKGIHGEFGIGLLSFWSLGEQIRIQSRAADNKLYQMRMTRGQPTYTVQLVPRPLFEEGTSVIVGPLLPATRSVVTGDRLQRYLSGELRDRIRASGVSIFVHDRIARKRIEVKPRIFDGERLDEAKNVPTRFGDLKVELYLADQSRRDEVAVSVCKDGTRVIDDVCQLHQLRKPPWNDPRLAGILDFESLNLAPGTRAGIIPDEQFSMFLEAVAEVEPAVIDAIHSRDRADLEKANKRMLQQLQKAFVDALQGLPENEYLFFDIPNTSGAAAKSGVRKKQGKLLAPCGLPVPRSIIEGDSSDQVEHTEMPEVAGPMATATILPRNVRILPGEQCKLRVIPRDKHGVSIRKDVKIRWRVVDGEAELIDPDRSTCEVFARREGSVTLEVACRKGRKLSKDRVVVVFTNDAPDLISGRPKGLPSYRCEAAQGVAWRSRYDVRRNEIVINSAHRDYINSRSKAARHRRYVGKLYAKEIVLMNFPHESPEGAMERLVEILMRTEDALS